MIQYESPTFKRHFPSHPTAPARGFSVRLPPWPEAPSLRRTRPASGQSPEPETEASSPAASDDPTSAAAAS